MIIASIGIGVLGLCTLAAGVVSLSCANDGTPGQSPRADRTYSVVGWTLLAGGLGLLVWAGYVLRGGC